MSAHVATVRSYLAVFGGLLVLTGVTTAVAYLDLGPAGGFVALSIAVLKALIVALYFMHLRHSSRLVQLFAAAGILWLLFLFGLTLSDYQTRETVQGWETPREP